MAPPDRKVGRKHDTHTHTHTPFLDRGSVQHGHPDTRGVHRRRAVVAAQQAAAVPADLAVVQVAVVATGDLEGKGQRVQGLVQVAVVDMELAERIGARVGSTRRPLVCAALSRTCSLLFLG